MGETVAALLLVLLGIGLFVGAIIGMPKVIKTTERGRGYNSPDVVTENKNYARTWIKLGAVLPVILAAIIFISAGFQSVPTKSVGVLSSFGKVIGTPYGPGQHWLAPWKTLNDVSDTIQSDSFLQSNGTNGDSYSNSGAKGYCLTVRLGGQQEGCADVQLQTQTEESAIPNLFANYASYGPNLAQDVDQFVVKRALITVLNRTLGDYSPVEDVSAQLAACDLKQITTCNTSAASQFSKFDPVLVQALQAALGHEVKVFDVNLQYIHYNDATEAALTKIQNSYTETAIQTQQEQTNAAISAANAALVSHTNAVTPQQAQQLCFAIVQQAIKDSYTLPLTWGNCMGGGGSTPSVIVNPGK